VEGSLTLSYMHQLGQIAMGLSTLNHHRRKATYKISALRGSADCVVKVAAGRDRFAMISRPSASGAQAVGAPSDRCDIQPEPFLVQSPSPAEHNPRHLVRSEAFHG